MREKKYLLIFLFISQLSYCPSASFTIKENTWKIVKPAVIATSLASSVLTAYAGIKLYFLNQQIDDLYHELKPSLLKFLAQMWLEIRKQPEKTQESHLALLVRDLFSDEWIKNCEPEIQQKKLLLDKQSLKWGEIFVASFFVALVTASLWSAFTSSPATDPHQPTNQIPSDHACS